MLKGYMARESLGTPDLKPFLENIENPAVSLGETEWSNV